MYIISHLAQYFLFLLSVLHIWTLLSPAGWNPENNHFLHDTLQHIFWWLISQRSPVLTITDVLRLTCSATSKNIPGLTDGPLRQRWTNITYPPNRILIREIQLPLTSWSQLTLARQLFITHMDYWTQSSVALIHNYILVGSIIPEVKVRAEMTLLSYTTMKDTRWTNIKNWLVEQKG